MKKNRENVISFAWPIALVVGASHRVLHHQGSILGLGMYIYSLFVPPCVGALSPVVGVEFRAVLWSLILLVLAVAVYSKKK